MANVTPNVAPGAYLSSQVMHLELTDAVEYVSFTTNGVTPAISEYIAYDTLTPPNPFIAVTQDGKGRVVYDGGFPKLYNTSAPAEGTGFSGLSGAHKYLYNAINWVANPTKVAQGNKKILVLGDANGSYNIKDGSSASGFFTTLTRIAAAAGFTVVCKIADDYPGALLNAPLSELEQYPVVLLMSSLSTGAVRITPSCVTDLITFRENGNGLIVFTDHGPIQANIEQATQPQNGAFFNLANRVVVNFGAYFSGDYNRTPVNVGFLRQTYGDHPLYNNLLDSESIAAGGSESEVKVASFTKYTKNDLLEFNIGAGRTVIQVLAKLKDGNIETYRFIYSVADGEIITVTNAANQPLASINTGWGNKAVIRPKILGAGLGTLAGIIMRGNTQLGTISYDETNGSRTVWAGNNEQGFVVNDQEPIQIRITSPFTYVKSLPVSRIQPDLNKGMQLAATLVGFRGLGAGERNTAALLKKVVDNINAALGQNGITLSGSMAENMQRLKEYFKKS